MTQLKTVFTAERGKSKQRLLSSIGDPYPLSNTTCDNGVLSGHLTLALKLLPCLYGIDCSEEADVSEQRDRISYLKCLTLSADFSLHECLIAELPLRLSWPLEAPGSIGRPSTAKHTRKSLDYFVVPNGLLDNFSQATRSNRANNSSTKFRADELSPRRPLDQSPPEYHWTLDLGRLADHVNTRSQVSFNEALEVALTTLRNRLEFDISGVVSM